MWNVIEKGSKKSNLAERYKISCHIILSLMREHFHRENIHETPCDQVTYLLRDRGFNIFLKKEVHQITNSVKARGVVYTLQQLSDQQKRKGVITISTGSFAYTLCHFGKKFKTLVTVVMPLSTADETINMCRDLGATVLNYANDMVEAHNIALRIAREKGLVYIDGKFENFANKLKVILPTTIDGCGLTAGIAMAIKGCNPDVMIIEVQSAETDPLIKTIRRNSMFNNELAIPVTNYAWHKDDRGIMQNLFDTIVYVKHTFVQVAVNFLRQKENVTDFNTAIGLAAIISGELDELMGKRFPSVLHEIRNHKLFY
ncbi:Threonine dehydratase catabolic [Temnothorax longispinosus]|uniref:L-serine deaminase n=1 Tax=Temnothorax longispinosus TaxID=300112 RepID=A0A4S2KD01_9HYME|nr:Threonine dehydratase catabolic [Temnothorax longispinosus]